ncbi:alpha/beta fold hydrolase [Spirosoma areae]
MKEPLILIPGTLCDASLFASQVAALSDLADCRVVDSSRADPLTEMAALILAEEAGNFALAGLSYGGIIAFEIWRQAPERVSKLILMNTNYKAPSETTRANQERFVGMAGLGKFREITTDILTDAMLHPDHAQQPELRGTVLNMALNVGEAGFVRQIKAQLARPDSSADLPTITCPTLLIAGREDKICPPALHEEMARLIPNSYLEIIEQCGHLSALEQPDRVNGVIRKWWLNNSSTDPSVVRHSDRP